MASVVVFSGEYDIANKFGLQRALSRLESSGNLVIDLTDVTYLDSTFIWGLIALEKARRAVNFSRVTIVTPAKSIVRRVFEVCGIMSIFDLVESYDRDEPGGLHSVVEFAATGDSLDGAAETKPADYTR